MNAEHQPPFTQSRLAIRQYRNETEGVYCKKLTSFSRRTPERLSLRISLQDAGCCVAAYPAGTRHPGAEGRTGKEGAAESAGKRQGNHNRSLLVVQNRAGVDACSTAGWNPACEKSCYQQHGGRGAERDWVMGLYAGK
jgi:hypothetical protein